MKVQVRGSAFAACVWWLESALSNIQVFQEARTAIGGREQETGREW